MDQEKIDRFIKWISDGEIKVPSNHPVDEEIVAWINKDISLAMTADGRISFAKAILVGLRAYQRVTGEEP